LTKIKKLNFVFKNLRLYFYILFLIVSRNMRIKVINIANTYINIFKKLENINIIIVFVNTINNLYIDKNLNNSRTRFFYLLKF